MMGVSGMLTRRSVLLGTAALAACAGEVPGRKRLAITMDDFAVPEDATLAMERDARIRAHLPRQAAAFVNAQYRIRPAFDDVLAAWAADGHIIANHGFRHLWASRHPVDEVTQDIARNHRALADRPGFQPYFRFPFLDEGKDHAQKLAYLRWLREAGYTPAPVTIDTVDWNVTNRLSAANPDAVRSAWLDIVSAEARYAHALALALGYRDLPHQMLVHHNALNALCLGDLLDRLRDEGWEVIDAKTALDFAPYAQDPPEIDGWGNWLSVRRQARGLQNPERPAILRDFGNPAMDARGL